MTARPLRVLVMDHTGVLAGGEIALLRLCAALGPEVDVRAVLFADGELRTRLEALGVRVDVVPLDAGVATTDRAAAGRLSVANVRRLLAVVPFLARLARTVRRVRPDVVHTATLKADLLGSVVAVGLRVPLVWYVHDRIAPDYLPARLVQLVRLLARHVPRVVLANSVATAQTLPGVACTLAYPGIDERDLVAPERVAGRTTGAAPVVGIVGRISPTKGQLEFVRAARRVLDAHPGARFRVVGSAMFGEDAYAQACRDEAVALGVADRVEWVGYTADPLAAMDALDVCVHASPVPEPFGQVIVEAMARGVPVVATRAGGAVEVVEPVGGPPAGLLVDPGDADALAAAVVEILDDPVRARARAVAAHSAVRDRFLIGRTVDEVTRAWFTAARRDRHESSTDVVIPPVPTG